MLAALRQSRVLALALLLAAPGLGGTWLSVAHPCPVDMPWLAQTEAGHDLQHSHGHGDEAGEPTSCNCVGACQSVAPAILPASAGAATTLVVAGWDTSASTPDTVTPVQPRLRRHPPATAPPLA